MLYEVITLVKDGGVGCDAAQPRFCNATLQITTGDHLSGKVVNPVTLSVFGKLQQGIHVRLLAGHAAGAGRNNFV